VLAIVAADGAAAPDGRVTALADSPVTLERWRGGPTIVAAHTHDGLGREVHILPL